jgi:hypothetical protein
MTMKNRSALSSLAWALPAIAFVSTGACAPEEIEVVQQKLTEDHDIHVANGVVRKQRMTCAKKCVEYEDRGPPGHEWMQCVREEYDCNLPPYGVSLHADEDARNNNVAYPSYADPGQPYFYVGCGRSAIHNVLAFLGMPMSLTNEIVGRTRVIDFSPFSGNIGHMPDTLAEDLQRILDIFSDRKYVVRRRSGVDVPSVIRGQLYQGNPVIVLGNGGGHWLTAVGFFGPDVYLIDYPDQATETRNIHHIDTDFVLRAPGGYTSDTVITIEPA